LFYDGECRLCCESARRVKRILARRRIRHFCVYYAFIGLSLICFGFGTFFLADELAAATPLARSVCGFLALFWSVRFVAGTFVFDLRPYLTSRWRRAGLTAANLVFSCPPIVYGWVALKGGK
jgi:hypothetical protein